MFLRCIIIKIILIYYTAHCLNDVEYQRMPPLCALDEYESCLVEEGSMYCMLQLTLYAEPGNQLMHMITQYSDQIFTHFNHSIIERGVCITKTCRNYMGNSETAEDFKDSLESCLNHTMQKEYGLSSKVSIMYNCDKHNEPDCIDVWDWTVLIIILGILAINIVGTFYDWHKSEQRKKYLKNGNSAKLIDQRISSFLLCFSVKQNWKMLKSGTSSLDSCDMQFFNGVRVISNICTVAFHVMLANITGFIGNPHDVEKVFEQTWFFSIVGGLNMVPIFLFISGFLAGYQLQVEEDKKKTCIWNLPTIIVNRVCRLLPALAMTLALTTSWARHVGSGPLWKRYVAGSLVADCRACWWHRLLFINNYVQEGRACHIQTWQLATEMQVFLVGVAAYLVSPRVMLPAALLLSAIVPALHTAIGDMNPVVMSTPQTFRSWDEEVLWGHHMLGHNNLSCFIIGVITATQVYVWQKLGGHLVKSRWWTVLRCVSLALIPVLLHTGCLFHVEDRPGILARAVYSGTIRIFLGLACALATFAFINRTPSVLKSILEWRRWVVPSRLTYCVFLLHIIFVHMLMGYKAEPSIYSLPYLVCSTCVVVVVSYLLAVPLHLMVEAPFTILCKRLAMKGTADEDNKDKLL